MTQFYVFGGLVLALLVLHFILVSKRGKLEYKRGVEDGKEICRSAMGNMGIDLDKYMSNDDSLFLRKKRKSVWEFGKTDSGT